MKASQYLYLNFIHRRNADDAEIFWTRTNTEIHG